MEEEMNNEQTMTPEEVLVEMQKNTVPKSEYEEMRDKYYKLFKATANGFTLGDEKKEETEEEKAQRFNASIKSIATKEKHGTVAQFNNLIEMHDYLTSHGKRSCFAPSRGEVNESTEAQCRALRDLMEESVESSNGDDTACSTYFASRLDFAGVK